ncbi:hypothetical protein PIB30_002375 [Stylosanthes scabra]|uniref:Transposase (putative) gypsy type domain-containing protein n=1 Tax=Stylosanthes scabra TaxID=79078 RepID=A0ABU6V231_9FABA|nr:hypothetical protein [Stylosanthes scabra]
MPSPIRVEHVGSVPTSRAGSVPSSRRARTPPKFAEVFGPMHCPLRAHPYYKAEVPDLSTQVGRSSDLRGSRSSSPYPFSSTRVLGLLILGRRESSPWASWSASSCSLPARVLVASPLPSSVASPSSPDVFVDGGFWKMDRFLFLFEVEEWKERDETIRCFNFRRLWLRVWYWSYLPEFSRVFVLCFINMARGDVNVKPTNVLEDMDWVDDLVLFSQSVMDEELIASFRESHAVCGTVSDESQYELVPPNSEEMVCYYNLLHPEERHFIYMYECLFSKLGVRVPFTQFEQDVLYECRVAPSQLHPNPWRFMKAFQTVCWYLHLDLSLRAFLYFFHITQPFSSRKKSQWSSFRAREGRRIFTLYEESFHNFKNYYFKLRAVEGVRSFYENEKGKYQFLLYWYSGPESPKFDFDDLDETDQKIVTVLSQCCVRAPFNTKILLTRSPSYIRTELEKMTNNSDAYKRMRARKKNQANRHAAAASGLKESLKNTIDPVSKVPPPGSEDQPVTNKAEFKVSLTPANPADSTTDRSKSKKRKAYGHSYGSVYSPDFDAMGFTDEFIMENSRIALDEAGLKSNLEFILKAGIKVAGVSRALQKKLADCPPTSRVEVDQLKGKLASLVKEKEEAEEELSEMKSELSKLKESFKEVDQSRKKAEAVELKVKVGTLEADLAKQKEEYEELEDDSIKSNDNIVENLRLQAKVLIPTLKVHLLHPDNYVAGGQIVWYEDLLPESEGPFFEEEAAVVGDAEKAGPQSGADDAEKTPPV